MSGSAKTGRSSGRARGACPLVGVGASAGGLKAFQAFFRAVPADSPLAYIVVQHLDPTHESKLPELLQSVSAIPVTTAANGGSLQGGKVYVVPEGRIATVDDGVIRLRKRKEEREQAIDTLFTSLAVTPATACAVLMSGYGADGVQGLREIAATGGLTFAQDPATAAHPQMPQAAIDAEVADFVGSPQAIAERLNEVARHLGVAAGQAVPPPPETAEEVHATESILDYVERETGVDFRHYKPSTMRRRIARRAMLRDVETLAGYLDVLREDEGEVRALLADLLINVTRFFRDEEVFATLRSRVFPEILQRKAPGEPIRIWVPGCSTGEEVYSLLITLIETLEEVEPKPQITIFGTDLSEAALRRARAAVYAEDTCGFVSPARLERFFRRTEHGYEIDKRLRDMCVFARQDVTRDTPFSRIDMISLRNVLIYMDQHLQRTVLAIAHFALAPDGFLVLGTSESTETDGRLFLTFDKQRHIYQRADVPSHLPAEATGGHRIFEPLPLATQGRDGTSLDLRSIAESTALEAFAPPRVVVDSDDQVVHFFGDTTGYLGHIEGRATLDVVEMAVPGIAIDLRDALAESASTNAQAEHEAVFTEGGRERRVAIVVEPLRTPGYGAYRLVAFQEMAPSMPEGTPQADVVQLYEAREGRLQREISILKGRARHVTEQNDHANEELRTANEEIQSSNEELQSLNEELETAKEELQSANEELITVNEELRQRNIDLVLTNDDLSNFMTSTEIPVIMLDCDLRIRRFTPETQRIAKIGTSDQGRELADLRLLVDVPDLEHLTRGVIETLEVCEREVKDDSGRWYSMQIRPYRTGKDEVEGAVVSFFDIDELRRNMDRVATRARLADALTAIDADIASDLRFDEIMQGSLEQAVEALRADVGTIEVREGDGWVLRHERGFRAEDLGTRLTDDEAPNATRAARTREPFSIPDMTGDESINVGFVRKYRLRSVLAVPLLVKGDVIGCLLVYSRDEPREYSRAEMEFARRLGASVSLALENARLLEAERHAARTAETLATINEILLSALTVDDVIARLVGEASLAAGADKSLVIQVRDGEYTVTHVRNVKPGIVGEAKDASSFPAFALAVSERTPVLVEDNWTDPRTNKDFVVPYELRAFQLLPLIPDDEVAAVLALAYDEPQTFDDEDRASAERMAEAMSMALKNAALYEAESEHARLSAALAQTSSALAAADDPASALDRVLPLALDSLSAAGISLAIREAGHWIIRQGVGILASAAGQTYEDDQVPGLTAVLRSAARNQVGDVTKDSEANRRAAEAFGYQAYVQEPVTYGGTSGVLTFVFAEPHARFDDEHLAFMSRFAFIVSATLENTRLYQAERETSTRLASVLDSMSDALVAVDSEWRYTTVNPSAEELIGRPASELLGRSMEELFPDTLSWPHYRKVMEERQPETFEVWSKPLERWLEIHAYPTSDGISILFADISERKRAEARTEARLKMLTAASGGERSVDDLTRVFLDEIESLTGSSIAFYHFVDPDQETLHLQNWSTNTLAKMCTAEGKGSHYPVSSAGVWADAVRTRNPVIHNDYASLSQRKGLPEGHAPVVRELVVPIVRSGRVVAVIGVGDKEADYTSADVSDVSYLGDLSWEMVERAAAEQDLAETRAHADQLAAMLEASSQPFGVGGLNGELLLFNHAFEELTGYSGDELRSIDWANELTPPEYREMETEKLAELSRTGRPVRYEKEYIRKDGSRVPIELLVGIICDEAGKPQEYYSFLTDLTERKAAEAALRESESRVRHKLDAILSPEADIGELDLADLIDAPEVQAIMEDFYLLAGIPNAIIDLNGGVLVGVGWQEVCTQFHRVNPESCKHCIESDVELTANVPAGEAKLYRCKNGMWDMASPVYVGGRHLGNVFTGQFFFEDEVPDYDFFRKQAKRYGFDEKAYLAALDAVPRLTREKVDTGMDFLVRFADTLSKLGYSTVQLAHSVSERDRNEEQIRTHATVMEGIGTILQAALNSDTEEELGDACLAVAEAVTSSAFGFIDEVGPDGLLHDIAISDPGWTACEMYDKSGHRREPGCFEVHGLYAKALIDARPFFTNSPSEEPDGIGTPEGHPRLTSFLGVPLFSAGKAIGTINVANKPGGYGEADVEALEELAPVVVEAFQRKRAEKASETAKERLDAHIDNSPLAVIEFDQDFRITRWSDEAEKMFGWSVDEVLGKAIGEFKWVYEEDEGLVEAESRNLLTAANPRSLNVNRNYRKDGTVIWSEWYDSAIYDSDGNLVSILSQVLEITERKRAEEALRESEQRYRLLFANMLDGFAYCRMIFAADGTPEDFVYIDVNGAFDRLTGLQGVVGKRVTEVIPGIRESNPELFEAYGRVAAGGEPEHFETDIDQLGNAFSVGVYCPHPGYFVAIFHNITEERRRLRYEEALADIRTAVSSTLEVDEIVHGLAEAAAETLETDALQIIMKSGERWVVTDTHGMNAEPGEILTDEQLPLSAAAVAERRPIAEIDEGGRATKRRSAMRHFGVGSILVIPLVAKGRGIGVIGLGRSEPIGFTELETYFATRLTAVAGLALDNALAYERERTIADTLQEAVLAPPPAIAGIESAYLYRAASSEAAVGGDFYDIFELDGGKVAIVVGDVSGKGLEAARLTSLVRDGIRAYALERDEPSWVLGKMNSLMYRSSPVEAFATLFFGVLDVLSGELRYTAAGHPPAVICGASGPEYLKETQSALVGAFDGAAFTSAKALMGPDDIIVLYTDGVIEARGGSEMYGDVRLLGALGRLAGTPVGLLPQALLDDVLAFTGGGLRDDTVIMCIRRALKADDRA